MEVMVEGCLLSGPRWVRSLHSLCRQCGILFFLQSLWQMEHAGLFLVCSRLRWPHPSSCYQECLHYSEPKENSPLLFSPLSFLCFHAFLGSAHQPINQQPLRDCFIAMHNGWMVCKTNVRTVLCSASISASVVYHQVASCSPCSPLSVINRTSRVKASGFLTGLRGWSRGRSSIRSWQTVSFHPPQHIATVPSQSLINSCHSSHNQ